MQQTMLLDLKECWFLILISVWNIPHTWASKLNIQIEFAIVQFAGKKKKALRLYGTVG